jgi:hypothetical protein
MQLGGIALGATGVGVVGTVAIWAISNVLTEVAAAQWDVAFDDLKQELAGDEECEKDEEDDDWDDDDYDRDDDQRPRRPRKPRPVANPAWIYDPSGYVFEAVHSNRVEGATATALYEDEGKWTFWDAEWYGQENPQVTDANGRYGWDVPEGLWKVVYQKEGYEPAESWQMQVPPPHMDVNVGIVSMSAPELTSVSGAAGGNRIDISFDKYMKANTVAPSTVTVAAHGQQDEFGNPVYVDGSVQPVNPEDDPNNADTKLAKVFSFVPDEPLTAGNEYDLWVSRMVQSYAGQIMEQDYSTLVTITADTPPGPVENPEVYAGFTRALITWSDPDDIDFTNVRISWAKTGQGHGIPAEISKGVQQYEIKGLDEDTEYQISITAVDAGGNESQPIILTAKTQKYTSKPSKPTEPPKPPSGSSGKKVEPVPVNEQQFKVDRHSQTITGFDGEIVLEIAEGAFDTGTIITIRRLDDVSSQNGLTAYSPVYQIDIGGVKPKGPIILKIKYDKTKTQSIDLRKLGIYRQDDADPDKWVFKGGIIDEDKGIVFITLTDFSKYAVMADNKTFVDLATHWSRKDVEVLISRKIVSGVSNELFEPDRSITRAEITKLLVEVLNIASGKCLSSNTSISVFKDVPPTAWYHPYVEAGAKLGIVKGSDGYFRPDDPVTREEMAVMILRTMGITGTSQAAGLPYSDASSISEWAAGSVAMVHGLGIMKGVTEDIFEPKAYATRAQAAVVVLRAMERLGLIKAFTTVNGSVSLSDVEGEHYELSSGNTSYVLVPAAEYIAAQLKASIGKDIQVTGELQQGANIYMRGPVLKVYWVGESPTLPGG